MATVGILSIFPELLNVNGDAENALVLAQRARWSGNAATVLALALGDAVPLETPDLVVIGSTTDSELARVLEGLRSIATSLAEWVDRGVPLLAVGTGMELLSKAFEVDGKTTAGLGIFTARAVAAPQRVTDDLVVDSAWGRLIGFENHARDLVLGATAEPLGQVVYGRGNSGGAEGVIHHNAFGTHLHGPVLAKNPAFADHLLSLAIEGYDPRTVMAGRVDDIAKAARNSIAARLSLETE